MERYIFIVLFFFRVTDITLY